MLGSSLRSAAAAVVGDEDAHGIDRYLRKDATTDGRMDGWMAVP